MYSIIFLLFLPLIGIVLFSLDLDHQQILSLKPKILLAYSVETLCLLFGVLVLSSFLAITLAWFVTFFEFPLQGFFQWALFLPMSIPSYVQAFIFIDFFSYNGLMQTALRHYFGLENLHHYIFFQIENIFGAILVFSLVLYPYLFLLLRANFQIQSNSNRAVSLNLGVSVRKTFFKVSLPLAKDTIIIGLALISMEVIQDFATVDLFSVRTISVAIYDLWTNYSAPVESARLGLIVIAIICLILVFELRFKKKFFLNHNDHKAKITTFKVTKTKQILLFCYCGFVLLIAFILPVISLIWRSVIYFFENDFSVLFNATYNSVIVSLPAVFLILFFALIIGLCMKYNTLKYSSALLKLLNFGYMVPGLLLAIGVLIVANLLNATLDWLFYQIFNQQMNFLLHSSFLIIIYAYVIRFFAFGIGGINTALDKINDNYHALSQLYGMTAFSTAKKIHIPLIKGSMFTVGFLIFVECIKELPATLILRPPNFDTVSTRIYQYASNEDFYQAALPSLIIVLLSLFSVLIINRQFIKIRS